MSAQWVGSPALAGVLRVLSCPSAQSLSLLLLHPSLAHPTVCQEPWVQEVGLVYSPGEGSLGPGHSSGTHGLPHPRADQSGILHEVHQPRHEPEEDAVQKADRRLWCEDQRGDEVGAASGVSAASVPRVPASLPALAWPLSSHPPVQDSTVASLEAKRPEEVYSVRTRCSRNTPASTETQGGGGGGGAWENTGPSASCNKWEDFNLAGLAGLQGVGTGLASSACHHPTSPGPDPPPVYRYLLGLP